MLVIILIVRNYWHDSGKKPEDNTAAVGGPVPITLTSKIKALPHSTGTRSEGNISIQIERPRNMVDPVGSAF